MWTPIRLLELVENGSPALAATGEPPARVRPVLNPPEVAGLHPIAAPFSMSNCLRMDRWQRASSAQ